jgi:hypothetical protein
MPWEGYSRPSQERIVELVARIYGLQNELDQPPEQVPGGGSVAITLKSRCRGQIPGAGEG